MIWGRRMCLRMVCGCGCVEHALCIYAGEAERR